MAGSTLSLVIPSESKLPLQKLTPWNDHKQIIVRVSRLWTLVDPSSEIGELAFLQGLLVDESFTLIQFSVARDNIQHFLDILKEGATYSISRFIVVPNVGTSKVSQHRYNLFFGLDTEILLLPNVIIPRSPLTLEMIDKVVQMKQDLPYLIDIMGFFISVTEHPQIDDHHGIKHKLVVVKLYSNGVYVNCNLFGNFLPKLKLALLNCVTHPPILLLESMKVKTSQGFRVTVNPDVPEIVEFVNRIDPLKPYFLDSVSIKNGSVVTSLDDEFLQLSQNRTISEIKQNDELSNSQFSCGKCGKNIENVVKNLKVILAVEDVTGTSEFTLHEHSAEMLFNLKIENVLTEFESKYSGGNLPPYPDFFDNYIGREVLFKIEWKHTAYVPYTDGFKVLSCCCDDRIIQKFKNDPTSARIMQPVVFPQLLRIYFTNLLYMGKFHIFGISLV
ncbi:hypothetical protein PIB30_054070 [Stylosanthes scabra]|uniref:Replication protein A 70 kDa DNA-binding subunit B/D first OB fold domain-containing protein n=1 Tax=Stylosanthes scabra TaxID=79078 RepID=A0ABU6WII3_9FABA|nr:hypothetical protein [Stylosanthes scabra]